MLTPERLKAIKERCERATKGPWRVGNPYLVAPVRGDKCMLCDFSEPLATVTENGQTCHVHFDDRKYPDDWRDISSESTFETIVGDYSYDSGGVATNRCDAEFIAHAREDVPALVAEVERWWAFAHKLREEIGRLRYAAGVAKGVADAHRGNWCDVAFAEGKAEGLLEAVSVVEELLTKLEARQHAQ